MRTFRRANLITGSLFAASAVILVGVVYFAFNIQVLDYKTWKLELPEGDLHVGDTIVVASTYTKLRQVTGTSVRTLECQARPGIFLSTPLNKVPANRAPGRTGTGVLVNIPEQIQGITKLPGTCKICIALTYPVLPGRTVPYFKCTKEFTLYPKATTPVAPADVSSVSTQTSPSPELPTGTVNYSSSSQTTPSTQTVQPNTSQSATPTQPSQPAQPTQPTQPAQEQPSLIDQLLSPIKKVIGVF